MQTNLSGQDRLLMLFACTFQAHFRVQHHAKALRKTSQLVIGRNTPTYGLCYSRFIDSKHEYNYKSKKLGRTSNEISLISQYGVGLQELLSSQVNKNKGNNNDLHETLFFLRSQHFFSYYSPYFMEPKISLSCPLEPSWAWVIQFTPSLPTSIRVFA
jgi:hypothetical protein